MEGERRRFPRIDIALPVRYTISGKEELGSRGVAKNLSIGTTIAEGGLLLSTSEEPQAGSLLEVSLFLPKPHAKVLEVRLAAKVVGREILPGDVMTPCRCNVHFEKISTEGLQAVKDFLKELKGLKNIT